MTVERVTYETGVLLTLAAENEVIAVPGLPPQGSFAGMSGNYPSTPDVTLKGMMLVTPGTGTTGLNIKWRRFRDFAFLNWYVPTIPVTAGIVNCIPIAFYLFGDARFSSLQALGLGWGEDVAMTVAQAGASANGNINFIYLESDVGFSPRAGH